MTSSMRRYLRQQYGTDDVKLLQKTLHVEAGDTADSRAKAAGMARSPGAIRAPKSKTGTLEDTFRRQIKSGVKGMSASESLPALMRTGGSSRKQHTASASQLPTLSAKTSETNGVPLKLRENPFGAAHYTKPKDERKREALRAILFKKLMARYANRVRCCPAGRCDQASSACHTATADAAGLLLKQYVFNYQAMTFVFVCRSAQLTGQLN